jgi:hypothetical protein
MKFTPREAEILQDKSFFDLKHSATAKLVELFGDIERALKKDVGRFGLDVEGLNISSGKIFRGENYRQYPYLLLDYPRLFSTRSVFACRTMFWWGNEFSLTMHLQGQALEQHRDVIVNNFHRLESESVYFCVNDTPWQYDFGDGNYMFLENAGDLGECARLARTKPFIKLSRKLAITDYEKLLPFAVDTAGLFLGMLK